MKLGDPVRRQRLVLALTLVGLIAVGGWGTLTLSVLPGTDVAQAVSDTVSHLGTIFLTPSFHRMTPGDAVVGILLTLAMAFLTTVFGGVIALVLGLLASQRLSSQPVIAVIRSLAALIRSIPTILWVLIFAVSAGLGSTAAVIGLSVHSISYLTKAFAESFDDVDPGVVEALKSTGATWSQIVVHAVLPTAVSSMISWTFLRFEINFANAVAMGAAAGAAGIGFDLFMDSTLYFDLHDLGVITYLVLAVAVALEILATRMKVRLKEG